MQNENIKFYLNQVAQFLITHAYAENDDLAKGNGLIKEITGDEESELNDLMDQIFEQYKITQTLKF